MTDVQKGGRALIAGNVALMLTMALHPTGEQMSNAGSDCDALALLNVTIHTLAILATPILFLGALALTHAIENGRRVATSAIVFYAFALVAGMCAAAMSGYIAPDTLRRIARAPDLPTRQLWRMFFLYTGYANQAFARILVVGSAVAIILWSSAMEARGLRWYGIVSNVAIIIAVFAGLPLNVHLYGLVVLLQAVWFITVGAMMWRGFPLPSATRAE